jgi:hypothetical protein
VHVQHGDDMRAALDTLKASVERVGGSLYSTDIRLLQLHVFVPVQIILRPAVYF